MLKRLERKRGKRKNKTVRKRNFKTTHCMRQGGCYQQIRHVYRETKCWGGGGGPKIFFLQYKSRVIAGGSIALMEREIRHATEDRDYWNNLVATCWDNPD